MNLVSKIMASIKLDLKSTLIYIGNFGLAYVSYIFAMIVQIIFWEAVYVAGTGDQYSNQNIHATVIGGYRLTEILSYTILIYLITSCNAAMDVKNQIKNDIMSGGINIYLMRPIHYILFRGCLTISKLGVTIGISIVMSLILRKSFDIYIYADVFYVLMFSVFVFFAILFSFLFSVIIGLLSFWLHETNSINVIYSAIVQLLSGGLLPLDYFREEVTKVVQYMPFTYLAYFPAQIMLKRINILELFRGLIICVGWLYILNKIAILLWRKGIRKYSAMGG